MRIRESAAWGRKGGDARSAPLRGRSVLEGIELAGTGHGDRETSWVRHTRFERARSTPDEVVALRYDSFENLVAAGVVPRRQPEPHGHPRPFPEAPSAGYVPDPPRRWSQGW